MSGEGTSLVGGSGGYPPLENVQIWRFRNAIFSACHKICLRVRIVFKTSPLGLKIGQIVLLCRRN